MKKYSGRHLDLISYPMGGIGAGMICLSGTGSLGGISLKNKPDIWNDPLVFSAFTIQGKNGASRIAEAPVPDPWVFMKYKNSGNGLGGTSFGLPRMSSGEFSARFPFADISLSDSKLPVDVQITGWSPFIPNDEDRSSLPVAALEYTFSNTGEEDLDILYYFCAANFMKEDDSAFVRAIPGGFILEQPPDGKNPHIGGAFCASTDEEKTCVDTAWFRGGGFDALTMQWQHITRGVCEDRQYPDPEKGPSPGGTLSVPFSVAAGERRMIKILLSWCVPGSDLRTSAGSQLSCDSCGCEADACYRPWYATRFNDIDTVNDAWHKNYTFLRAGTLKFTDCFFNSTLPEEILEAVSANLCILKSPTVLRQADGRLWGWEGCFDDGGCCSGSCTHVWNYAQSICHLFPRLERSLRETEFYETQDETSGHQCFRASLPIRKSESHTFHAASDGQLGGIIKAWRDWRISGDTDWLRTLWPALRKSLEFCIRQWDPDREGVLRQPHHNTYDIEFWGPDIMCTAFYLGALNAASNMGETLGDDCSEYLDLYRKGRDYVEHNLFNGAYFYQQVVREGLNEQLVQDSMNSESRELLEREGPRYQYGTGCLSDALIGVWLSEISGLSDIVDEGKLRSTLLSIYKYNFRLDLSEHANPQRPGYALKNEAGLLLCTWPCGNKPSLPFIYSDEVWTGIEYQVASHLIMKGYEEEGLEIIRSCRNRYDGTIRNPFNEYECGHFYARAMASYALLQAYSGVRYDNLTQTIYARPRSQPYRTFLSTATGYGTVTVTGRDVKVDVVFGQIEVKEIQFVCLE